MEHITRIARIIDQPSGHSLLVGVGGSGKQSLSKLSAFILELDVFRIQVSTNYTMADLKTDIQTVFTKAGAQGNPQLFILTDGQIIDDRFLMYINDILSTGYIPELFASDELEAITGKVRAEAKSNGYLDTPDDLFKYFLEKCKKNLHLDLCFSPVGDAFRIRSRMFPGLINSTSIDYFHPWPRDALIGVANRFLGDIDLPTEELCNTLSEHMAFVHLSIDEANEKYRV
jgi:dynein heavy chain